MRQPGQRFHADTSAEMDGAETEITVDSHIEKETKMEAPPVTYNVNLT